METIIYIVTEGYDYEGEDIIGIFSSLELAKEMFDNKEPSISGYVKIEEYKIDDPKFVGKDLWCYKHG